jgi:hypothetical protein
VVNGTSNGDVYTWVNRLANRHAWWNMDFRDFRIKFLAPASLHLGGNAIFGAYFRRIN